MPFETNVSVNVSALVKAIIGTDDGTGARAKKEGERVSAVATVTGAATS